MARSARSRRSTGSATATARAEGPFESGPLRRRPLWRSPIARRILLMNVLVLIIPVVGLLHLEDYRQSLLAAERQAMTSQAETAALALALLVEPERGVLDEERVQAAEELLRHLLGSAGLRARLYANGRVVAQDGPAADGPLEIGGPQAPALPRPPPEEPADPLAKPAPDPWSGLDALAEQALEGRPSFVQWPVSGGWKQLRLALPVRVGSRVPAAILLVRSTATIERRVAERRSEVLWIFAGALGATILLSLYLAYTIAIPLNRLAEAADGLRPLPSASAGIPDLSERDDELGDLSLALGRMTQALTARIQLIERFAADVAHELKNPLSSLRSAVETLARVDRPEQQARLRAVILDDVSRLDRLITDISAASRMDAQLAREPLRVLSLATLLRDMTDAYEAVRSEGVPPIVLRIGRDQPLAVRADPAALGHAFRNLFDNALSFSPAERAIVVEGWNEIAGTGERLVIINVDDSGPGIPAGKQEAIFERFYSERPTSEKFGTHSGLGLSIVRQILAAYGGEIQARNRPEGGARFTVRLPAA